MASIFPGVLQSSYGLPVRSPEPGVVGADCLPAGLPIFKSQCQIMGTGVNIQTGISQGVLLNTVLRQFTPVLRVDSLSPAPYRSRVFSDGIHLPFRLCHE